jgi:uncharacterized surface protein with fasciclin (FAS1) repeats
MMAQSWYCLWGVPHLASLLEPRNKESLTTILTYHVVAGGCDLKDIKRLIQQGKGTAEPNTVGGDKLCAMVNVPSNVVLKDAHGHVANIIAYDVDQPNGVIHTLDAVVLPDTE